MVPFPWSDDCQRCVDLAKLADKPKMLRAIKRCMDLGAPEGYWASKAADFNSYTEEELRWCFVRAPEGIVYRGLISDLATPGLGCVAGMLEVLS